MTDPYYPHVTGEKATTRCPVSANQVPGLPTRYDCNPPSGGGTNRPAPLHVCSDGSNPDGSTDASNEADCAVTVIDHFTSSFHWADGNVSAIWLRRLWYLVTNSVLSDVQQGGLTFVTGGDVTRSSIISGYWGLSRASVLIGHSQPEDKVHAFARDIGPFNADSRLECDPVPPTSKVLPSYCLSRDEGISMPLSGFFNNERLENIYDGPSYRDSNAYLDVSVANCAPGSYDQVRGTCIYGSQQTPGLLNKNPGGMPDCYLPNAAIAWKQPNGFFYPPAFHATNLYFSNVDIRHFVIDPLWQTGTYITDADAVSAVYCSVPGVNPNIYFNDFSGIDRQTELNDDDGSLTGLSNNFTPDTGQEALKQTISVNEDDYFTAPIETPECASNIGINNTPGHACTPPSKAAPTVTAKTSPYDYVSTFIWHPIIPNDWDSNCGNPACYGVPLYRQFLAGDQGDLMQKSGQSREWARWVASGCNTNKTKFGITPACRWPFIRMSGTNTGIRETLTVNNATYYLDTTVPASVQISENFNTQKNGSSQTLAINVFDPGQTYYVFFAYAKPNTQQTYQIYLGTNATADAIKPIQVPIANQDLKPITLGPQQNWLSVNPPTSGIVSVTVDFKKLKDGSLDTVPANGLCQPHTFCQANGTACQSALTDSDPLVIANPGIKQQADAVCSQWAVKDLDCPPKGCYGFSFTVPTMGFTANATKDDPSPNRPVPDPFPSKCNDPKCDDQGKPPWPVSFLVSPVAPDSSIGGQCHYEATKLPGTTCAVPDWVPVPP